MKESPTILHRYLKGAFTIVALLLLIQLPVQSQKIQNEEIKKRIEQYKKDSRGPYKEIRWFCKDGTVLPPQERCPEPGGVQRARHKDEVRALSLSNHLFLGQILATTPFPDFWDADNFYSRLKQYEIEKYLQSIDNGWILRKAQFYRGAYQAEDEANWGMQFYSWLMGDKQVLNENYFLIRQSMKVVPHFGDNNLTQEIRNVSKLISEKYPPFLDLRVKIHGQPEESDLQKVEQFWSAHRKELDQDLTDKFSKLMADMKILYQPVDLNELNKYVNRLDPESGLRKKISAELFDFSRAEGGHYRIDPLSRTLFLLREDLPALKSPGERVAALDLSIAVERLLMLELSNYKPESIREQLNGIKSLGMACAGCGYIEMWEWEQISNALSFSGKTELPLETVLDFFDAGRRLTEWGTGMFRAQYTEEVDRFEGFETLVNGFMDDRVRSSLLLNYGHIVELLGKTLVRYRPDSNHVMDIQGQQNIRGLNPGFAAGELVVITGPTKNLEVERDKIYVFNSPPPDLKPVAGIATVSEGNTVSHVQLLARNLGIPNAVLSPQNLEDLKAYSGQAVFYAVSSAGTVIMKPLDQISPAEKKLIETRKRNQDKVSVPVEKIDLSRKKIIPLSSVNAQSSGVICGPKAANLGQLKILFPDHVVNGIVVPFGIFRMHLDQIIPGKEVSYWQYLQGIFDRAEQMNLDGADEQSVEAYLLQELEFFRKAIKQIGLKEEFLTDLKSSFISSFGHEMGHQPVFLRSDTNMEDLKDFTGAGLNLTVFNVSDSEAILQGIRDVWASPYTERSYKWRQQYLLNPENVFPSILIIPTVDVDYSGVMVTRGISNQQEKDLTVAFNRGAGGAVDGQAAESYLLSKEGERLLLSPAREPSFIRLPASGGSVKQYTSFEMPILNNQNIEALMKLAGQVRKQLPGTPGIETSGPFDIELGFKDNKLWLFQVRPFVENKNAAASDYLGSLNPAYNKKLMIRLDD